MAEHFKLDTTEFDEAWRMYVATAMSDMDGAPIYNDKWQAAFRQVFMSGGAMAIAVLSNRLAQLPGTVEPGDMVKALIDTIASAMAELETKTGASSVVKGNA
jgi:hypothetical protein